MTKKKFVLLCLVVCLALCLTILLTACQQNSNNGDTGNNDDTDKPTLSELDSAFYDASNWEYMTNNDGASLDGGDVVYSLNDGSIKFHRENQAIDIGDMSNETVSFMLKGTNDWNIWFNSNTKDNNNNCSYRLAYAYGGLRLAVSTSPEQSAANIVNTSYKIGEWNRFDVVFDTADGVCQIKVYVNGVRASLTTGDNTDSALTVDDNVLTHRQSANFTTGSYVVVKVWWANDYVQLKPVAKASEDDIPIIAVIGDSITEGAGASNFYTDSYPAQMQNMLGGGYNVINFGNSGKTLRNITSKEGEEFGWLKQSQWLGVQAVVPDIAIINLGSNDSKTTNSPRTTQENFRGAYDTLIAELLMVNPDMQIIICTSATAYSSAYTINDDNITNIIVPVEKAVAEYYGYTLIDLNTFTKNKSKLFPDGIHPSTRGYTMFAEIISKVIAEGADALTADFLADIDQRYNDFELPISDVHASISKGSRTNQITLTVTGKIDITSDIVNVNALRLGLVTGIEGEDVYVSFTLEEDGNFSITNVRLDDLTGTAWYNVRIYLSADVYYFVRLSETGSGTNGSAYRVGRSFNTDTRLVTVVSWNNDGEDAFCFVVSDYVGED